MVRKPLRSYMPSSGSLTPGLCCKDLSLFQQEVMKQMQLPGTVVGSKEKTESCTDTTSQAPDMKFSRDPVCA